MWRYARMVAAEGRKAGIHLALALQDPTHKSLDLRIRRNCLPISFRVKDGDASRVILGSGGAERLPPRQFLTVMDRLIQGVAFAPSDEEIRAVLTARPVAPYPVPDWLEGETAAPQPTRVIDPNEQEIVDLLAAGRSLREIQQQVFGYAGGAAYEAVKRVQARLAREE
jgi:DNA segregation ATPase FtsK/SpoIIIE-like protein